MKKLVIIFLSIFISSNCLADSVDDLRWIGQNYPPYSYVNDKGENAGIAIDVLAKILRKTGSSKTVQNVEIKNFSKIFVKMNNDQNTVFFPLARLPEREDMFKWVGPIFMDKPVVFAKASSNITITSVDAVKQYKIAGREGYPGVKQLNLSDINSVDNDAESIKALSNNEVDLVICDELSGNSSIKAQGLNPKDYQVVYRLNSSEMSFAFNKDTDDAVVAKVAEALKAK